MRWLLLVPDRSLYRIGWRAPSISAGEGSSSFTTLRSGSELRSSLEPAEEKWGKSVSGIMMGGTAREQILAAIGRIRSRSGDTFTITEVLDELRSQGSSLAESTIRTHITSRMCGDSPDHHGTTYDDLERVDRGVYRLRRGR